MSGNKMWDITATPFSAAAGETANFFQTRYAATNFTGYLAEKTQEIMNEVRASRIYRTAIAAGRRLRYGRDADEVRQLFTVGEMQHAPECMESYLVAMPEYRKQYNLKMAAGFEDGFSKRDIFRGVGYMYTDPHYRMVTSGLSTEYDEETIHVYSTPIELEDSLSVYDKMDTLATWRRSRALDWEEEDPHSTYNAAIG